MLNASVKELENKYTFHSIVAPAEKLRILLLSATTRMWKLVISIQNKEEFLDPNQRLNLGIVQMGTTKVALDPKAEFAKWMIIYLRINWW
jgi:hypothetical protein